MFIGSIVPLLTTKEVVPQAPANLSKDDLQVLANLSLPSGQWNNVDALLALYNKTEYDLLSVQISRPKMELNCSYVLEQIELFFKKTSKETGQEKMTLLSFRLNKYYSLFQLFFTTMAMGKGILVTGVSKIASSPSKTLLIST